MVAIGNERSDLSREEPKTVRRAERPTLIIQLLTIGTTPTDAHKPTEAGDPLGRQNGSRRAGG